MWVCDSFCGRMVDAADVENRIAELESQLASSNDQVDLYKQRIQQLYASVEKLKAQLTEARKDTARLDWLEGHKEIYANTRAMKTRGSYYEWQLVSDSGIWNGHTFRAAIDAAREG
jgi:multidrug resistance efflux pump